MIGPASELFDTPQYGFFIPVINYGIIIAEITKIATIIIGICCITASSFLYLIFNGLDRDSADDVSRGFFLMFISMLAVWFLLSALSLYLLWLTFPTSSIQSQAMFLVTIGLFILFSIDLLLQHNVEGYTSLF